MSLVDALSDVKPLHLVTAPIAHKDRPQMVDGDVDEDEDEDEDNPSGSAPPFDQVTFMTVPGW
ncbi:MAG TPA: hypothetical protein VE569_04120 [Acidimicrobiia bacterium]|nr:hypothetical protein [Acidimicrobiia bacterium]